MSEGFGRKTSKNGEWFSVFSQKLSSGVKFRMDLGPRAAPGRQTGKKSKTKGRISVSDGNFFRGSFPGFPGLPAPAGHFQ